MKKLIFPLLFLLSSCQLINEDSRTYDLTELEELYEKIVSISESKVCTNPSQWKFTAIGNKACGGPTSYIAYSSEINESEFLDLVAQYTKLQKEYNSKNNIGSDCSFVSPPSEIKCENGKAVFFY
ncbi:hypothetical protein [Algoriphagus sp.]|uniref:hypothetical protein n=1 Tax=Algoriphagus sp. TaxID=1872435 RepID=UPI0025E910B0|nr:hypothetical protein [Algoriphagus sp.]